MRAGISWVFFDLGETLIDEGVARAERLAQLHSALAQHGLRYTREQTEAALLRSWKEFAPWPFWRAVEMLAGAGNVSEWIREHVRWRKELERPYPQALHVLQQLALKYSLGVIANQGAGAEARLEAWGFAPFISICLSSAEEGLEKPDPAIFRLALAQAGCSPEQAVMVGDRIDNDIRPAKALGWQTIRVLQGFAKVQEPRVPDEVADVTVAALADVVQALSG